MRSDLAGRGVFQLRGTAPRPDAVVNHGSPHRSAVIYGHFGPLSNPAPVRREM